MIHQLTLSTCFEISVEKKRAGKFKYSRQNEGSFELCNLNVNNDDFLRQIEENSVLDDFFRQIEGSSVLKCKQSLTIFSRQIGRSAVPKYSICFEH